MQIWLSQGGVRGKTTSQPYWWRGEPETGSSAAGKLRLGLDMSSGEAALGFGKEEGRRGLQGACAQFGCAKSMPGTCGASRGFEGCTRQQGASQHPTVPIGLPRGATLSPFPPVLAVFPGAQRPWVGKGSDPHGRPEFMVLEALAQPIAGETKTFPRLRLEPEKVFP